MFRTRSQTIVMVGFLVSCVLCIGSLLLPAYYVVFGATLFGGEDREAMRLISTYYSWPVIVAAVAGIVTILARYRKLVVLITGGIQFLGIFYQIYRMVTMQNAFKSSGTYLGKISDVWASLGGSGISIEMGPGYYCLFVSAAAVLLFAVMCYFMVDDQQ